jgi:hypothetical protein
MGPFHRVFAAPTVPIVGNDTRRSMRQEPHLREKVPPAG